MSKSYELVVLADNDRRGLWFHCDPPMPEVVPPNWVPDVLWSHMGREGDDDCVGFFREDSSAFPAGSGERRLIVERGARGISTGGMLNLVSVILFLQDAYGTCWQPKSKKEDEHLLHIDRED